MLAAMTSAFFQKPETCVSCIPSSTSFVNSQIGQCHRYRLYEMSPIHWIGRRAMTVPSAPCSGRGCAAITSAVPSTGRSAAAPGNGVRSL